MRIALAACVALTLGVAALAWVYTRPIMSDAEVDEIRASGRALLAGAPEPGGSVGPTVRCAQMNALQHRFSQPTHFGRSLTSAEQTEIDVASRVCRDDLTAAWDHALAPADADANAIASGAQDLADQCAIGPGDEPAESLEWVLRGVWATDAIVRSGRLDRAALGLLAFRAATITNLNNARALTEEEAARLRPMLERVRASHPRRWDHPERFAIPPEELERPTGVLDDRTTALSWVCTERRIQVAQRLAALHCERLSTRACFEAVVDEIASLESSRENAPAWAPLMPARARRRYEADCDEIPRELAQMAQVALEAEIALVLLDEAIEHSVAGSSMERAQMRPVPTFEGDPMTRRTVGARDETMDPIPIPRFAGIRPVIHHPEQIEIAGPSWASVGGATPRTVLTLYPPSARTPTTDPPAEAPHVE